MARRLVVVLAVFVGASMLLLSGSATATPKAVRLTVWVRGYGRVQVGDSSPRQCLGYRLCRMEFTVEPRVRLQATPLGISQFRYWRGCLPTHSSVCHLRPGSNTVHLRFDLRGSRVDPIPLGSKLQLARWTMSVQSVRRLGSDLIVQIQATNSYPRTNWTFGLADWIFLWERSSIAGKQPPVAVAPDRCTPPKPNFLTDVGTSQDPYGVGAVDVGQTVIGNLCFPLTGGAVLRLFVQPGTVFPPPAFVNGEPIVPPNPPSRASHWFALR